MEKLGSLGLWWSHSIRICCQLLILELSMKGHTSAPGLPLFSLFPPDSLLPPHSYTWKMGFSLCPPRKFFWFFYTFGCANFWVIYFQILTDTEWERKMRAACWNGKNERELEICNTVRSEESLRRVGKTEDFSSIPSVFCLLWFKYNFLAFIYSWLGHGGDKPYTGDLNRHRCLTMGSTIENTTPKPQLTEENKERSGVEELEGLEGCWDKNLTWHVTSPL